uniref:hypothetical protein n=1 Tax=Pseudomonas syringae group genomosp. 7 TaxID=251699 RepID=UPI00376F8092
MLYVFFTATVLIYYDEVVRIAVDCQPIMMIAGFSAFSMTLDFRRFREIGDNVGA